MSIIPLHLKGARVINAASAIKNLMDQGVHPCCDVDSILKMLPRKESDHDDYAIAPAQEVGKGEV